MALRKSLWLFIVTFCYFLIRNHAAFATSDEANTFLFVSLRGDNAIAIFRINPQDGSLEKILNQPVSGGPAALATDDLNRCLYVAQRSSNHISAYQIHPENGKLSLSNSIAAVDNPVYLSTDRSSKYLLSAYFAANKAAVYSINQDGTLQTTPTQVISTGTNPHAVLTDPSNRFLYLTNMTGNKIQLFRFDSISGKMNPSEPAELIPPANTGPRHMVFHRKMPLLYVVNELGNSVSVYQFDNESGSLTARQIISTLPDNYTGSSKCADIHLTPDNHFLYASNRGHESLAAFQVDTVTGLLSNVGIYPTVNSPREFDIDPTGTYLYAAGETSNNLAWYKIDKLTGTLDSLGTITVGKNPSWVLAVRMEEQPTSVHSKLSIPIDTLKMSCLPNPFYDSLTINFTINKPSSVKIFISDSSGKEIALIHKGKQSSGQQIIQWNTTEENLPAGIYYCTLQTKNASKTIKIIKENEK